VRVSVVCVVECRWMQISTQPSISATEESIVPLLKNTMTYTKIYVMSNYSG